MSKTAGKIGVISMGCSKNLVDSERLMRRLGEKGYSVEHDPEAPEGDYVVVNTCGFIGDAKEESVNMILGLAELKNERKIGKLVVMGCLSERYRNELKEEIPEVDLWYGKFDWKQFCADLPSLKQAEAPVKTWERSLTTPPWSAYIKISEGCNRHCAYCAIPLITGKHKSRPIEEIVEEVKALAAGGVKEFNVIAQDLSAYGIDLYGEKRLAALIEAMAEVEGVEWIRLHYAYPTDFPWDVLDVIKRHSNVCRYLDVALQHISDPVLKNMRRHITKEETLRFLERLRREVPDIRIRTTLMTGFPGEGEAEFEELLGFVKEARFDRMGAFAYSEEEDTWAARNLSDDIPDDVKHARLDRLMSLQQDVAASLNEKLIGHEVRVLVERKESDWLIGRTQWDSPEVDPEIYVKAPGSSVKPGEFINAVIERTEPFELYARLA